MISIIDIRQTAGPECLGNWMCTFVGSSGTSIPGQIRKNWWLIKLEKKYAQLYFFFAKLAWYRRTKDLVPLFLPKSATFWK